jgi:hypothetical protein
MARHFLVALLAFTRLAQRSALIRIQSGVALSTVVRGVYFTLAGSMEGRSHIGPTPIDAACGTRGTYGDKVKPSVLSTTDGFAVEVPPHNFDPDNDLLLTRRLVGAPQ